ncbi:hypothetical protein FEZ60_25125 [Rhodococcus sp. MS16]|uniref:hypothetical protein n=1 Tax=Rhodococcus sp. MS16 TaxID=2579941 RepID=UPI001561E471|nr:hypothetical protein [Rhodococcus sp. MS16]NRI68807.1 hypothetical protein [Rhodococcus sp. MS16]
MTVQEKVPSAEILALHHRMSEDHRAALVAAAHGFYERTDPHAETDSLASNVTLDDGDLIWHIGDGRDILFTIVEVYGAHVVRAMEQRSVGWATVTDHLVDPRDATGTAEVIWQLISLLTE